MNNFLTYSQIEILKWSAVFFMVIDHSGRLLLNNNFMMLSLGRIAFPLFAFILVYNYIYNTKNKVKYISRLLILGIISQPFFMYAFNTKILNVLFTLSFGLVFLYIIEFIIKNSKNKIEEIVGFLLIFLLFLFFSFLVDYIHFGILIIFFFYLYLINEINKLKYLYLVIISILIFSINFYAKADVFYGLFGILSLLLIFFIKYINISIHKTNKFVFYSFYPLHLSILIALSYFLNL